MDNFVISTSVSSFHFFLQCYTESFKLLSLAVFRQPRALRKKSVFFKPSFFSIWLLWQKLLKMLNLAEVFKQGTVQANQIH